MYLIEPTRHKHQVLCYYCHIVGVYEDGLPWACERCGGGMFYRANLSASYDKVRDKAGGDDKLLRACKEGIRRVPKRRIRVRWDGGNMIVDEKPQLLGVR